MLREIDQIKKSRQDHQAASHEIKQRFEQLLAQMKNWCIWFPYINHQYIYHITLWDEENKFMVYLIWVHRKIWISKKRYKKQVGGVVTHLTSVRRAGDRNLHLLFFLPSKYLNYEKTFSTLLWFLQDFHPS